MKKCVQLETRLKILNRTSKFWSGTLLDRAEPNAFAVVLLDFTMPKMDGAQLAINSTLQIVMYSGDMRRETLKTSYASGITDFIDKAHRS